MSEIPHEKTASAGAVLSTYTKTVAKYPLGLFLMLIGVIGMQVANLVAPLYLRQVINIIAENAPSEAVITSLLGLVGLIALWWSVRWVSNRLEHFVNVYVITAVMSDLITDAFGYLINHSYNFFISNFAGSLTHKVNKFTKAFQIMYESLVVTFLPATLFAVGAIGVLFLYRPLLGAMLGVWVVLFVCFQIWVTKLRQPLRKMRAAADTLATATLADAISNQSTIMLFSGSAYEHGLFKRVIEVWRKAGVRSWNADALIWSVIGLFMLIVEIGLLYAMVILWNRGLIVVGDFVLVQAYLLTLFERLVAVQIDLRRVFDAFADGGEMVSILRMPYGVPDKLDAEKLVIGQARIEFKEVDFYFNKTRPVLTHFNLTITAGEKVALVGPSGAGKTTITKLLLRLYDVQAGSIEIDGQNIAKVTQDSLREAIAFVPQEPILFHRTLIENIRYGRRDATDEEVIEAAKKAHCHEFIDGLPEKYSTYVGERGVKLSGGERQRVAIARAILKNAPILILDEATSSLDSESEALIQDALTTLMEGKTVLVIAHRLSTIMKMDRILVLEGGRIVAEGTHQELLNQGGLYQKLWNIQAGGFIGEDVDRDEE